MASRIRLLFSRGARSPSYHPVKHNRHFSRRSRAGSSERIRLLNEIYSPFHHLRENSAEYKALVESGRCWSEYFDPGNTDRYRYKILEKEHSDTLHEIDSYRGSMKIPVTTQAKALVNEYAHQSVNIENNPLQLGDALRIGDSLSDHLSGTVDLASRPASDLASIPLPLHQLLPGHDLSQVAEIRNHILASSWVAEVASRKPGTAGLGENEIRSLSALMIKDTASEALYAASWGGRTFLGDYRRTPIGVRSNHLRVFPYHAEVAQLMKEFFTWRDDAHTRGLLHPLLLACHSYIYFVSIHPFLDGDGRVGRTLMQDYLIRQGYPPVVMQNLEREEYLAMVSDCHDGEPDAFVERFLSTQYDMMRTFHAHGMLDDG